MTKSDLELLFRYFLRKNFPGIGHELKNNEIDEIGNKFHKHVDENISEEVRRRIMPISIMDVMMKTEHPFRIHGFDPAYILHFTEWLKEYTKFPEELTIKKK